MYLPQAFTLDDPLLHHDLMDANPFALLIAQGKTLPLITPLPLLRTEAGVLLGHLARANTMSVSLRQSAEDRSSLLAVFSGPHAYVSPRDYASNTQVPTWNYLTVECEVRPRLLHEEEALASLQQQVRHFEGKDGWQLDSLPEKQVLGLMKAIQPFELEILNSRAKAKLGQNKSLEDQLSLLAALHSTDQADAKALARWMKRLNSDLSLA